MTQHPTPNTQHPSPITFVYTDIEGSTRLWERDAAVMWRVLERHNAILSEAISGHGGCHFKTIGDAYQAAFDDPAAAVDACVAAQRALAAEPWAETGPLRVRMALHCLPAEPTPDGDYQAQGLNRLAALMSVGHGGQVLLSAAVREAVADRLPAGVELLSLGRHRLRDLLEAEEIWQLVASGLPATFPPLKSLERHPTNLPRQPNPLIGRENDVAALQALLADEQTRLLTLIGPGGVGKTRLALAAAAEALEAFADGAFLVSLAGVEDAALLLPEIAAVLGIREGGGRSLTESVHAYFDGKRLLLLLDNLEQLRPFDDAAAAIAALLQSSPGLRVLATSRAPLRLRAEREWPVGPLPTPDSALALAHDGSAGLAALAGNPAVTLFIDRARAARPAWSMTAANAPEVAEIVRRLEGLPLAIELAAARVRVLTPAQIVQHLGDALDLLAARAGDRPDRQQTLRGAIAWSHDLLNFELQAAFRRLAVFRGGFTIEAAEAVLAAAPAPWIDGLDAVSILVEQNLLRATVDPDTEHPDGTPRYRMLETIRAFAQERLEAAHEADAMHRAHAAWAERFARDADARLRGAASADWLDRLEREHDNFRAAIAWATAQEPDDLGLRLPEAIWRFWQLRGHYTEGRTWLQRALSAALEAPPRLRALALEGFANLAWRQGDLVVAATAFEEALATWRAADDRGRMAVTMSSLGVVAELLGDFTRARALQESAVAMARDLDDPARLATALNNLATVLSQLGEPARAATLLEESIALKRREGNMAGLAASLTNLAILMTDAGDLDRAIAYLEETLAIDRELGNPSGIADTLGNLAALVSQGGDLARAAAWDGEALQMRHELGDRVSVAYGLESIASTAARAGYPNLSVRLFGAAQRLREEIGSPLPPAEHERYERGLAVPRAALTAPVFAQEWESGRALSLDAAVTAALQVTREIAGLEMAAPMAGASATPAAVAPPP